MKNIKKKLQYIRNWSQEFYLILKIQYKTLSKLDEQLILYYEKIARIHEIFVGKIKGG